MKKGPPHVQSYINIRVLHKIPKEEKQLTMKQTASAHDARSRPHTLTKHETLYSSLSSFTLFCFLVLFCFFPPLLWNWPGRISPYLPGQCQVSRVTSKTAESKNLIYPWHQGSPGPSCDWFFFYSQYPRKLWSTCSLGSLLPSLTLAAITSNTLILLFSNCNCTYPIRYNYLHKL